MNSDIIPDTKVIAKELRRPAEPYVIPALRNRKTTDNIKTVEQSLEAVSLNETTQHTDDSTSFSDTHIGFCCVIISGFPLAISPEARENMLSRFYSSGGKSHWLSSATGNRDGGVVLFAYSSERKAASIIQNVQSSLLHVCLLADYTDNDYVHDARKVGLELIKSFKPDIDPTAANRMIGAALGIRIPGSSRKPVTSSRSEGNDPAKNAKSESGKPLPVGDAWDY